MHEDDLRRIGNLFLWISVAAVMMGVAFSLHFVGGEQCYILIGFILIATAFAAAGLLIRYLVWKNIKDTTIKTRGPGGWEE